MVGKMKAIGVAFLAVVVAAGAFARYKLAESPMVLGIFSMLAVL
jgi:hypothetical protein